MLEPADLWRLGRDLEDPARRLPAADQALPRAQRRAQGAFFTPPPLVDFVVDTTLTALWQRPVRWRDDGSPELTVLDPAAGDGRFLASAARWLARRAVAEGKVAADRAIAAVGRCLIGIERDSSFAAAARQRLPGARIIEAEALLEASSPASVDVVVGNPPYVRSIRLERSDRQLWSAIRGRYAATSYGEWDLYAAFIEQSADWLAPRGHAGLVVPSRWMTAQFAAPLRARLGRAGAVRGVIDFGARQLFDGATTYPSVLFLSRQPARRVFVGRWGDSGWDCGDVCARELDAAPWRLSVGRRRGALEQLSAAGTPLGEVAHIVKGVGTNADRVYALERARVDGSLVVGWSRALAREVALEGALVRMCLRGRDVGVYVDRGEVACLYPYRADGTLLSPAELRRDARRSWRYLCACRDVLDARERGRFRGETFYRFGRPQNLAFFADPAAKVVVPDVARGGRALVDRAGRLCLDTAYAARPISGGPAHVTVELIAAVLNSPYVALWLAETGVPLRGNYVRMKTAYLRGMPVPDDPESSAAVSALVRSGARPEDIDGALARAFGVPG